MTKSKKTSKTRQKFDFPMITKNKQYFFLNASRSLLCIQYVAVDFRSEEVLWRREPPGPILAPPLDPPLGGFGPRVNTNVRGHDYFIPTKFGKYPSSNSVVKADYVFQYIYMHRCIPPPFLTSINK